MLKKAFKVSFGTIGSFGLLFGLCGLIISRKAKKKKAEK